jgi:hypothetical protein
VIQAWRQSQKYLPIMYFSSAIQTDTKYFLMLPDRIFFTGVPGSRWSGIAQEIEANGDYNTSDRTTERCYSHREFSGHVGAYFGTGMEFSANLEQSNLDLPYTGTGCKLHKSHEWAYKLHCITAIYPNDWIILVYRSDSLSFNWWKQAGGFKITYPDYSWYENDLGMIRKIREQNQLILEFAQQKKLTWTQHHKHSDVFIATYKGTHES